MAQKHKAPGPLPEAEWAFHKVPKRELRFCAEWELARLCGKKQPPWLKLTESAKQRVKRLVLTQGAVQELPLEFAIYLQASLKEHAPGVETVALLIDFTESEGAVLDAFRYWLRSRLARKKKRTAATAVNARWRSLLAKIVVLRAVEAGFTRVAAQNKTAELWKQWRFDTATEGFLSPPHWSRALREAKTLRTSLATQPSLAIGDPPYGDPKSPSLLVFIGGFAALAGRRSILVLSPEL